MRKLGYLLLLFLFFTSCRGEEKMERTYLYDLQISEQVRWHRDGLSPIPDSFATMVNIYSRRGTSTYYKWSKCSQKKFDQQIQNPTDTLSAQLSDSLYQLVQRAFANLPVESDRKFSQMVPPSDITGNKIDLETSNSSKASMTLYYNRKYYADIIFFLFRHSRKQ